MGKVQNILNSIFNTISSLKGQLREMFGLNFSMDLLRTLCIIWGSDFEEKRFSIFFAFAKLFAFFGDSSQ